VWNVTGDLQNDRRYGIEMYSWIVIGCVDDATLIIPGNTSLHRYSRTAYTNPLLETDLTANVTL
jgi:hypothetical protein